MVLLTVPPGYTEWWTLRLATAIASAPARLGNCLVVATEKSLVAVDARTGQEGWRLDLPERLHGVVATDDLFVTGWSLRGKLTLVAFDAKGRNAWTAPLGWTVAWQPLGGHGDRVSVVGNPADAIATSHIGVIEAATGRLTARIPGDPDSNVVRYGDALVWANATDDAGGVFLSPLAGTGTRRLSDRSAVHIGLSGGPEGAVLVAEGGRQGRSQGCAFAIDLDTGAELWAAAGGDTDGVWPEGGEVVTATRAASGRVGESVEVTLRDARTGAPRWSVPLAADTVFPLLAEGVALCEALTGTLALDRGTGAVQGALKSRVLFGRHACASAREVYATTPVGILHCWMRQPPPAVEPRLPDAAEPAQAADSLAGPGGSEEAAWDADELIAFVNDAVWSLGARWSRLAKVDPTLKVAEGEALLSRVVAVGAVVSPSVEDVRVPLDRAAEIAPMLPELRAFAARVRAAGRIAFAAAPWDPVAQLLCESPWPQVRTELPAPDARRKHPVHLLDWTEANRRSTWADRPRLAAFPEIVYLDLSRNDIGEGGLGVDLSGLPHLRVLVLDGNLLDELPPEVRGNPTIESLSLSENPLRGLTPDALRPFPRLRHLTLVRTRRSPAQIQAFAAALPGVQVKRC
jgi:hypothetical protein